MTKIDKVLCKLPGLLISIFFLLTLIYPLAQVQAQEPWPPFDFRLIPSYQEGKITYNIRFSEQGEASLTDVTIKILLPEGTRFLVADAEPSTNVNFDGAEITFFTAAVYRPIRQAYFIVEVTDPTATVFTTHAWISWKGNPAGDYLTDDESIDITLQPLNWEPPPEPRLRLQVTATVSDTEIIYAIYPKNVSNRRIWDLNISMPVPEGAQFLSAEAPPSFVANFDGQEVSFSIIEMEKEVEITPLRFRVSVSEAITPFLVTHAWASWKNAGRGVGQTIVTQDEVRTGDIIVQPYIPQLVVSDVIGDTPFGNYDVTNVALQEISRGNETALKITFYTTEPLDQTDEPLEFNLWIDSDCRSDTGQPRRNIAADYRIKYNHKESQSELHFWDEQEQRWHKITNLHSLTGGKMVTVWTPYHLIDNSDKFCWTAQAQNETNAFNPNPPSDWIPHWRDLGPGRYEAMGTSPISQFDAPPPFYGIEETDGDQVSVLKIRANHGIDNAEEIISTGQVKTTSSDLELGIDDGSIEQIVGVRFQNVFIPQGASISNAYIEFETDETKSLTTSLTFYGQAADSAPPFTDCTSGCYDLSKRLKTIASVAWDNVPPWNSLDEKHQTPNLASLVQEIVDRDGWVYGNSLVFLITGSGTRTAKAYNGATAAAPLLHLEYTIGASALLAADSNESDYSMEGTDGDESSGLETLPTSSPQSSINGKLAVPLDNGHDGYDIYIFSIPGGQEITRIPNARQPHFRFDGQRMLINHEGGGVENLFEYNFADGTEKQISDAPKDSLPFYNLDASRVVYNNSELFGASQHQPFILLQCGLLPPHQETEPQCRDASFAILTATGQTGQIRGSHPVWTADDMIAYKGCSNIEAGTRLCGIYIIPASSTRGVSDGFIPVQLTDNFGDIPSDTKGDLLTFTTRQDGNWEAYVMNLDGTKIRNLSKSPASNDGLPTISPDNNWVAFVSDRGGQWAIWVTPVIGGPAQKLFNLPTGTPWGKGDQAWTNERISWAP